MNLPKGSSIRRFEPGDEIFLHALTIAAITQIGYQRYSPEQVNAWAARFHGPDRFLERANNGAIILVAVAADASLAAYALLEVDDVGDGHVDMLYCHPQHSRKGLAEALLAQVGDAARNMGLPRLYTEASELARPAFERVGYTVLHRRDFTIRHKGADVAIHNFAMEKALM